MTQDTFDDQVLDDEWLAAPRRRSRVRLVLAGVLAASVCFLGGALTQKHFGADQGSRASPVGGAGLPAGPPEGFPQGAGGFPGTGGSPGQQESAAPSDQPDSADAVIGNVVEIRGNTWLVEDLGGERHQVTVTDDTDITREESLTASQVTKGDTVNITGSSTGGRLAADHVTLR
jgi:hypothetical protein